LDFSKIQLLYVPFSHKHTDILVGGLRISSVEEADTGISQISHSPKEIPDTT
jgi:hypothetical protein